MPSKHGIRVRLPANAKTVFAGMSEDAQEVARLRRFLAQLDQEINERNAETQTRIAELEDRLAERDALIAQLRSSSAHAADGDDGYAELLDRVDQLQADNQRLHEIVAAQEDSLSEAAETNGNLHAALNMLQTCTPANAPCLLRAQQRRARLPWASRTAGKR